MTNLDQIADGVFAWLQPGGESGVSNAGVIADDDGLTIVDTLMVRSQWEPFAAAVAKLGQPIRRLLLTHAHVDHVGGTTAFPNAAVFGSPQTSDLLDGEMPVEAYKAFMPAFDAEFDELAELGTRPVTHLVTDAAQLTPRIEVLPATGHTAGDLMALVADVDVLFAGDLCFFGVTPLAFQGDPKMWADVLDAVAELADVISLVAQAHTSADRELADAIWEAGAVSVGWGASEAHSKAKALARADDPGAAAALRAAAQPRL
jgi:cyclase